MDYKNLIKKLKCYGTIYAIGDSLDRETEGSDELMLEAAAAIKTLLAERDAAVSDLDSACVSLPIGSGCLYCAKYPCADYTSYECEENSLWEWRGPTGGEIDAKK